MTRLLIYSVPRQINNMNQSKYINNRKYKQLGFTLLELLMVIAVIGVLASIAVPRLQNYSQKAKFTEVINATGSYKVSVERCITENASATNCNGGSNGIPSDITVEQGKLASLTVSNGVITAKGNTSDFKGATYIMTPTVKDSTITWAVEGTCASDAPTLCEGTKVSTNSTSSGATSK